MASCWKIIKFDSRCTHPCIYKKCFKLSALSPDTSLAFHSGSCKIPYKPKNVPNDKSNSLKHVRHIVPKLQQNHSRCIRQSAMPVNSTVQQYILVNTKVSYPYLSAIPSVSFSHYKLWSHIKHTVCMCVSCYYICREVTHKWYVTFLFHLPLYVLY